MRFGGRASARVRRGLLAAAVVTALAVVAVTVAVPLLRDRSQQRLERRADREVTATAQRARSRLLAEPAATDTTLRRVADDVDGVEVLAVRRDDGVRLVFRVWVAKTATTLFGWQRAAATGCFAQVVRDGAAPMPLERLPCPS
ncbi:hypothetical protein [Micromonospora sp. NPDC092111]|uniref:hypothetical protein n=1 Tax=Micromonospora sp. NPDC092111 TaxID=3364289 RepID=UPI0037F2393A